MSKEKLLTLSFQDAEIQRMVEERMSADETLTRAAALRAIFTELKEGKSAAENTTEHIRAQLLAEKENAAELNSIIARMENDCQALNETIAALEESNAANIRHINLVNQQRDAYKATSMFDGLPEEAVTYMQTFFDELVGEGHYISPQMFALDLLRRVQEGTKFFIPNNKQIVKKEWIRQ